MRGPFLRRYLQPLGSGVSKIKKLGGINPAGPKKKNKTKKKKKNKGKREKEPKMGATQTTTKGHFT
jgi:hypothetical protein